jgi:superkiller protein 3
MASSNKAALKAAKAALDSHKYEDAIREARKVLDSDPKHYHAYVYGRNGDCVRTE